MFEHLKPTYYTGEFSIRFCFFLINLPVMAWFCTLVYCYCNASGFKGVSVVAGTAAVVTSRYTIYFSALPLVDSLISVATALVLLGIKIQNKRMIVAAIFLGPLAKESFIFVTPLVLFFSGIPLLRQLLYFLAAGTVAGVTRLYIDHHYPVDDTFWLVADAQHFDNINQNLDMLFSWYGIYKIFINLGLWVLIPLAALVVKPAFLKDTFKGQYACLGVFLFFVLIQMLLSGSMERMFYPALIVFSVVVCAGIEAIKPNVAEQNKQPNMN